MSSMSDILRIESIYLWASFGTARRNQRRQCRLFLLMFGTRWLTKRSRRLRCRCLVIYIVTIHCLLWCLLMRPSALSWPIFGGMFTGSMHHMMMHSHTHSMKASLVRDRYFNQAGTQMHHTIELIEPYLCHCHYAICGFFFDHRFTEWQFGTPFFLHVLFPTLW